ncbi:MAG: F0F1 ATP synthase subunit A [Thermodesulfobacteriota bacterium]
MEHPFLFSNLLGPWAFEYKHIIYSWVAMAILIAIGITATRSIKLIPGKGQNFLELAVGGIEDFMVSVVGEEGRWVLPVVATVFLYILTCNLIGLIPGFFPPTANINTTASCAVVVFFFTHYIGIRYHGVKYIKHFTGPVLALAPLFIVLEIIGHLARVLSLSFRLFGNMEGHELVLGILFMLAGAFFAPLPIMALGVFVSLVQAFVFFLLSCIYFAGAMEHAH